MNNLLEVNPLLESRQNGYLVDHREQMSSIDFQVTGQTEVLCIKCCQLNIVQPFTLSK